MNYSKLLLVVALLLMVTGCVHQASVIETRKDATITFTHDDSGQFVAVTIAEPYKYAKDIDTEYRGVPVKGPVFTTPNGASIVVAKMKRGEFEELTGLAINAPKNTMKSYPPKTILEKDACQLVRAYVVTLDSSVVAAVSLQGLDTPAGMCIWKSLDEVKEDLPEKVNDFDLVMDEVVTIKTGRVE